MNLDLSRAQLLKARKGLPFQLKHEQIGSGMGFNLHPTNVRKVHKAYQLGKGVRLELSPSELDDDDDDDDDEIDGAGFFKKMKKSAKKATKSVKKTVKKTVNKGVNKADKLAKKHVTEKNLAKYSLRGYNKLNEELAKQGMDSIHGAILNEGLGYVPFVPQGVKDVAGHYAEKEIDRQLDKQTKKTGAGFKKSLARPARNLIKKHVTKKNVRAVLNKGNKIGKELNGMNDTIQATAAKKITKNKKAQKILADEFNTFVGSGVNPYLPTGLVNGGSVKRKIRASSGVETYADQDDQLRANQSGFRGMSMAESELMSVKRASKSMKGSGFRAVGGGFRA
jgi:hypothetical protein